MVSHESAGDLKPNCGSVTSLPCTCPYLPDASEEPDNPIVFDTKMNEYHLTHFDHAGTGVIAHSIIFHCPRCGGTAPQSKRGTFFAHITDAECHRLRGLTSGVRTVAEAIAKFGPPNEDHPGGFTTTSLASDTEPSISKSYRLLRYTGLSDTANVTFIDQGPDHAPRMSLETKYIGEPKAEP